MNRSRSITKQTVRVKKKRKKEQSETWITSRLLYIQTILHLIMITLRIRHAQQETRGSLFVILLGCRRVVSRFISLKIYIYVDREN